MATELLAIAPLETFHMSRYPVTEGHGIRPGDDELRAGDEVFETGKVDFKVGDGTLKVIDNKL